MNLDHFALSHICDNCRERVKVTGYRCVPRVRARASGRAIPIQRNSKADTSCSDICVRALIIIAIYNARASAGCSQVARQRPF